MASLPSDLASLLRGGVGASLPRRRRPEGAAIGPKPRPRKTLHALGWATGALAACVAAGCGASSSSNGADNSSFGGPTGANGGLTGGATSGGSTSGGASLPPEQDVASYGAPVATGRFVWIANPSSGRVAYIDARSLEIKLVEAGDGPTFLAAVPDPTDDVAVVLNVRSLDATVLRASAAGLAAVTLPVPASGNAWSVSASGRYAIAWTDAREVPGADPVSGYQDVAVLDLARGKERSVDLTVGYRPIAVAFDAKSEHAYAVTQDGISVIDLAAHSGPAVVKNISVADVPDAGAAPPTPGVAITPDGKYAFVRQDGIASVRVVSLADGSRTDVAVPSPPTGLGIAEGGRTAVAVLRDTSQVALLPIPGIVSNPHAFGLVTTGAIVGSASLPAKSPVGFFFTNAVPDPDLSVVDTSAAAPVARTILLRAPVLAVFPSPDASQAVVLHDALDTAGSHFPGAASLVPVALGLPPKIVGLAAPAISVAVSPAGDHALVAAGDDSTGTYQLALAAMPSLEVRLYPLASLPIAAGIVAGANRGYVAQKNPDGRITFIDLKTGEARTMTGFELATQVVDGSQ